MVSMLFMTSMLTFAFYVQPVTSILPVHNVDTGFDYATIQEAINAPETLDGHTILVDAGVYYENVVLNKTLSLIGENKASTVIDANNTGNAITIEADYCIVENFTIQNGGFGVVIMGNSTKRYLGNVMVGNAFRNNVDAIGLSTCDRNVVANNTFEGNGFNVIVGWVNPFVTWDVTSNNNTITRNNMTEGISGVLILYSHHNIVSENNIINMTDQGITFLSKSYYAGPPIVTNNSICNNVIVNCTFGLIMSSESYRGLGSLNNVSGNIVRNTELGVYIYDSGNNTITNNDIVDNTFGMYLESGNNLLRANTMLENVYNFVDDIILSRWGIISQNNDVETSNTVNGKSIYYIINQTNLNINPSTYPDMGFLVLKNCSNVIIENMKFSNNGFGIALEKCANVTVEKTTIENNIVAVSVFKSVNIAIRNSIIQNNLHGLALVCVEPYSEISNNMIVNNTVRNLLRTVTPYFVQAMPRSIKYQLTSTLLSISGGIYIHGMNDSALLNNTVSNNERGIYLDISIHNIFKNNTMANNVYNFGQCLHYLFPIDWVGDPPDPPQISPHLINDVDASNTVDGKPIYWWINRQNEQVPSDAGYVLLVNCTNMTVKDLALQNNTQGILLVGVSNSLISNNMIKNTAFGIVIHTHFNVNPSTNNKITRNNITGSGIGIRAGCPFSIISNNVLKNNLAGMRIYDDLTVTENTLINNTNPPLNEWVFGHPPHAYEMGVLWYVNGVGIILRGSNTTVRNNLIQHNSYGISVAFVGRRNKIYHNNFINNTEHIFLGGSSSPQTWDNGYPNGGNYWSNYNGTDLYKGPNQDQPGGDGIGDTPYVIDGNNRDNFPLTGMFSNLNATSEQQVQVICNSTLSDFQFNGTAICFNVTGAEGTTGFCRICIPRALISNAYRIFVNGTEVSYSLLPCSNNTHNYLYFTYEHSTQEVVIITELPSTLVLPLFTSITLIATILIKKKEKQ